MIDRLTRIANLERQLYEVSTRHKDMDFQLKEMKNYHSYHDLKIKRKIRAGLKKQMIHLKTQIDLLCTE